MDLNGHGFRHRNSNFLKLILNALLKSDFHNLHSTKGSNKPVFLLLSHHSLAQVLKDFTHVRNLQIELPSGDAGTEEGVLLKWRAVFGSSLQKCVILRGTSVDLKPVSELEASLEDSGSIPESICTNGALKSRVVWTMISSLIAASTRHYLLQPIIMNHPTLKSLVLTDGDGQGTLSMGEGQLKEFRENPPSASSNRTEVPAANMEMKYAPYLELPCGMALRGTTLVTIKPSSDGNTASSSRAETDAYISGSFDNPFKTAVKALMKRRTHLLEMKGF
ncbi:F-box protein At4g18380-like isoform X2 [Zingiber officinale]|uniref:F-box protein At4g18380-like isoform X2 n=1 Tax=Zingiber officinale TaxID=94328 RepID=UPI001C4DD647|nr:F-box protein At4g18380-like isoform X2 [Zingiber officinale]